MGSCAAPSAKGDDKFITTDYLQQCPVVQPAPDSSISEVICTNLDYAQYSCGLCCKNREA
ncbi:hypothetical protein EI044_24095 [Escherichia coli]|uniref:Replication initiator protein n=1 Tax=Escherichia coli TaxID=562 RepID=A0A2S1JHP0_ECOLX|nr:hypothetical protein [Escherichia coli]QIQ13215.1 Secreted effector protein [Salmonella enterica]AWF77955.1 hypothetical protein [Escherichia coli]MDP4057390.1 hypothetical protein [Escherichia coli]MDW2496826.1 hypothetical protein [Escherichia coli]MDW2544816.1 hypothetical protein [Escherichia coli]